jgi:hypothetical protein
MLFLQTMIYDTLFEAVITFKKKKNQHETLFGVRVRQPSESPLHMFEDNPW